MVKVMKPQRESNSQTIIVVVYILPTFLFHAFSWFFGFFLATIDSEGTLYLAMDLVGTFLDVASVWAITNYIYIYIYIYHERK